MLFDRCAEGEDIFKDKKIFAMKIFAPGYQYHPFNIIKREHKSRGVFHNQGSFSWIVDEMSDGTSPEFIYEYEHEEVAQPINLTEADVEWLKKHRGMTLDNSQVELVDLSRTSQQLIEYMTNHIQCKGVHKQILGDYIWIVLSSIYCRDVLIEKESGYKIGPFRKSSSSSCHYKSPEKGLMIGFLCLRFKVNRDGTLGDTTWVTK